MNVPATNSRDPKELLPLTHLTYHILLALKEGPLHGYAIGQRIDIRDLGKERIQKLGMDTVNTRKADGIVARFELLLSKPIGDVGVCEYPIDHKRSQ